MQIAVDVLRKYEWQCIVIPPNYWPNPKGSEDDRSFMVAVGADIVVSKRVWWKATQQHRLVVRQSRYNNHSTVTYG